MTTRRILSDPPPGAEATAREILQQPEVWRHAAAIVDGRRAELDAFLRPVLDEPRGRVVLIGAGTSAFAGGIAAPALTRRLGRRVDAVATTDIVASPAGIFAEDVPTLLVSFARSGDSPESVAAVEIADRMLSDVRHLVLTCNPGGRLARELGARIDAEVVLMPPGTDDQGFAMTSSFTSMLLSCLRILGGSAPDVSVLADAAAAILRDRREAIAALAAGGFERMVYLGSGPLTPLARESALKLLELTAGGVVTYFDSPLGFRHGPKSVLDESTLVLVYLSNDPYTRRYDLDLVRELRATVDPSHVVAIGARDRAGAADASGAENDWLLDGLSGEDDAQLALPFVVVAQLLALDTSLALGLTPDDPFPAGEVNRVVQGVTIHPLPGAVS